MSEISAWYAGKNVLITGATGFIGKVLVEKILSDCDEVNCIYLIVRGKKNFDSRCEEFLNHIVFDHVRKFKPKQLTKIKIFQGDLGQENLGLSSNNLFEILDKVEIVLHSGADVRFDLSLCDIFYTNTVGTYRFLELAKQMKNLQIFVFVSTAYSQSHQKVTEERHYDAEMDAFALMKAFDRFGDQVMLALQPKILKEFPNTYSFSKHLSEDIVYRYRNDLPICVVRPSVVSAAIRHPIPDYTEGLNGYNGWSYALLRGVMRTMYMKKSSNIQTIPVDIVADTIIATSWIHGTKRVNNIEYYNVNIPDDIMKTFVDTNNKGKKMHLDCPLNYSISSPNSTITSCAYYFYTIFERILLYYIRTFFYQILPSALLDVLIWIFTRKPVMLKIQRKIYHGSSLVIPYLKKLKFETDKFKSVRKYLNEVDQVMFDTTVDWFTQEIFLTSLLRGIRKFIAKEKDEDLPRAIRNNLIWYWIHIGMQCIVMLCLVKFAFSQFFY